MAKDAAIVTMEGEQETVPKFSNGTTFNDPRVTSNPHFKVTIIFNVITSYNLTSLIVSRV